MFNIYKLIFFTTLFSGTLISISSFSWLGTWMGLEINLLSFIPILNKKNNSFSSESSIKYFLVQAMASTIFLFSILMSMMKTNFISEMVYLNQFLLIMMNSALLMKMGAAPFHFWFPEIIEGMNWMNSLILMTWQKIAPMMIISYSLKLSNFIILIIMISTAVGSIGGLNQISLRKILVYSSINHIGWLLSTFLINETIWYLYFIIYSLITMTLTMMFNSFKIFYLKQMFMMMNKNKKIKFMLLVNMLSLGGLPPFLGFLSKWIVIQELSYNHMLILLFMIMMTLITLFFYLRISYSSLIFNHNELNFNLLMKNNLKINLIFIFMTFFSITGLIFYTIFMNFL